MIFRIFVLCLFSITPALAKDTPVVQPWIGDRKIITDLDGRPKAVVKPWVGDRKIIENLDGRPIAKIEPGVGRRRHINR